MPGAEASLRQRRLVEEDVEEDLEGDVEVKTELVEGYREDRACFREGGAGFREGGAGFRKGGVGFVVVAGVSLEAW